ncbi:MAG: rubredoxin [Eubacteriales bacterium]|nr:rubredoxin [Eubacteriales bacterium]
MQYVCQICGYVYDEEKEQIPFAELPDDWTCPLCGAAKADFLPREGKAAQQPQQVKQVVETPKQTEAGQSLQMQSAGEDEDLQRLSTGQLAALCSNLARGCEKQYKEDEAALFTELAQYFTAITPVPGEADIEKIAALLQGDIEQYPAMRAVADAAGDRGAARICVWGEKVTRMLASLVNRYLREGEVMTADTEIWLCTTCGFVYIGQTPPKLCPVCKVPDWKFEKIEGRMGR